MSMSIILKLSRRIEESHKELPLWWPDSAFKNF